MLLLKKAGHFEWDELDEDSYFEALSSRGVTSLYSSSPLDFDRAPTPIEAAEAIDNFLRGDVDPWEKIRRRASK